MIGSLKGPLEDMIISLLTLWCRIKISMRHRKYVKVRSRMMTRLLLDIVVNLRTLTAESVCFLKIIEMPPSNVSINPFVQSDS